MGGIAESQPDGFGGFPDFQSGIQFWQEIRIRRHLDPSKCQSLHHFLKSYVNHDVI